MIENYLHQSPMLKCVFLLVDIRHEPSANDKTMYDWVVYNGYQPRRHRHKAGQDQRAARWQKHVKMLRTALDDGNGVDIIPFSAETKQGREEIWGVIEGLME